MASYSEQYFVQASHLKNWPDLHSNGDITKYCSLSKEIDQQIQNRQRRAVLSEHARLSIRKSQASDFHTRLKANLRRQGTVTTHYVHVFISHSWSHSAHYQRLHEWLFEPHAPSVRRASGLPTIWCPRTIRFTTLPVSAISRKRYSEKSRDPTLSSSPPACTQPTASGSRGRFAAVETCASRSWRSTPTLSNVRSPSSQTPQPKTSTGPGKASSMQSRAFTDSRGHYPSNRRTNDPMMCPVLDDV